MPVYEYECTDCKYTWEQDQRITEEPIKECPKCTKATAKRLVSRTAFILAGGGWANEGYSH